MRVEREIGGVMHRFKCTAYAFVVFRRLWGLGPWLPVAGGMVEYASGFGDRPRGTPKLDYLFGTGRLGHEAERVTMFVACIIRQQNN